MRRVNRRTLTVPTELLSGECSMHLTQIINDPVTKAKPNLYRGHIVDETGIKRFTVVEVLKKLYNNKCAYCEKFAHDPKMDHHRPQGRVVGESNTNMGYYWLVYEWTNLLPTCTNCNEIGAKGARYPIRGTRNQSHPTNGIPAILDQGQLPYNSGFNAVELPLILHPEFCFPHKHFDFDRDGKIIGLTAEGISTINTIGLDNEDLNGWRRKIYNKYNDDLSKIIFRHFRPTNPSTVGDFSEQITDWVFQLVKDSLNVYDEYVLFKKKLLLKLDYFFLEPLDDAFRPAVSQRISEALQSI